MIRTEVQTMTPPTKRLFLDYRDYRDYRVDSGLVAAAIVEKTRIVRRVRKQLEAGASHGTPPPAPRYRGRRFSSERPDRAAVRREELRQAAAGPEPPLVTEPG